MNLDTLACIKERISSADLHGMRVVVPTEDLQELLLVVEEAVCLAEENKLLAKTISEFAQRINERREMWKNAARKFVDERKRSEKYKAALIEIDDLVCEKDYSITGSQISEIIAAVLMKGD